MNKIQSRCLTNELFSNVFKMNYLLLNVFIDFKKSESKSTKNTTKSLWGHEDEDNPNPNYWLYALRL